MTREQLTKIREYIVEYIMRDADVMYADVRDVGHNHVDLIFVIASLYEELHKEVTGKPYEYMFHWANKVGSWTEDDLFKERKQLVQEISDFVGGYNCTNSLELADKILERWGV